MSTRGEIRQEILDDLKETSDDSSFSADNFAELNRKIDRAIELTALVSESPVDFVDVTVEEGVGGYTLPSDNLLIKLAYFGDVSVANDMKPLDIYTQEVLKSVNPFWMDESAENVGQPKRLLLLDGVTVFTDPKPSAAYAGKTLRLWYVFKPTAIASDGESPNIALAFHGTIHFYASFLCYLSLKNPEMAASFYKQWENHYSLVKGIATRGAEEVQRFKFTFAED